MEDKGVSDALVREIERLWGESKVPVRLADLGKTDPAIRAKGHGKSLSHYISSYLGDRVSVLKHSTINSLVAVVPKGKEPTPEASDAALTVPSVASSAGDEKIPRYNAALWKAFRAPIEGGKRRFVVSLNPVEVVDQPETSAPIGTEVKAAEIVDSSSATDVHKMILDWAARHGIPPTSLVLSARKATAGITTSLLARFLDALGPEDLERISMPLDIVQKLHKTQI
jgi:hypothetical protein